MPDPDNQPEDQYHAPAQARKPLWRRIVATIGNHTLAWAIGAALALGGTALLVKVGLKDEPRRSPPEMLASLRVIDRSYLKKRQKDDDDLLTVPNLAVRPGGDFALLVYAINRGELPASNVVISLQPAPGAELEHVTCYGGGKAADTPMAPKRPVGDCKFTPDDLWAGGGLRLRRVSNGLGFLVFGRVANDAKAGAIRFNLAVDSLNADSSQDSAVITVRPPA